MSKLKIVEEFLNRETSGHPSTEEQQEIARLKTICLMLASEIDELQNRMTKLEHQTSPRMIKRK